MKIFLLSISLTCIVVTSFGQMVWDISFDDTTFLDRIVVDTNSNPNNIWKIGHPNKTVFTTANSSPNVIVTDTMNSYPPNDTSSFTVIHLAGQGWQFGYPKIDIGGWYSVNSDTLTDYGYIEFSADLGNSWLLVDNYTNMCSWEDTMELPVFSGNSNGWKHFYHCIKPPTTVNEGDTILYRFTFISDNLQTNKDGLMFDDLHFEDWAEGIEEFQNDNLISIFPNPATAILTIQRTCTNNLQSIQVINCFGQVLYNDNNFTNNFIDIKQLKNGIYYLKYSNTKEFSIKKFVVTHNQ
jgi:hypothetical protein